MQQSTNSQENKEFENDEDLLARLKKATEIKDPGNTAIASAWDFDDKDPDETTTTAAKTESTSTSTATATDTKAGEEKTVTPIERKKELEGSAEAATSFYETFGGITFESIVKIRHKNKFTEEEKIRLDESDIIDADIKTLTGDDLRLRNKYDRVEKAKNRKLKEVQISDDRRDKFYKGMYKYYEITGKSMGPEGIIIANILDAVIHAGVEAFTD